jgi:hypothetical protein
MIINNYFADVQSNLAELQAYFDTNKENKAENAPNIPKV